MAWFKMHTDVLDDANLCKISKVERWNFVLLMSYAKELEHAGGEKGVIKKPLSDICWRLRMRKKELERTINALESIGEILHDSNGIRLINYARKQHDPGYLRLKKHREKRSDDNANDNTSDNANETYRKEVYKEEKNRKEKITENTYAERGKKRSSLAADKPPPPPPSKPRPPQPKKTPSYRDPHCSTRWYNEVYAPLWQDATGQAALCRAKEFGQAKAYFEALQKLNQHTPRDKIYHRATLGAELAFTGWREKRGPFHWLTDPPDVGWLLSNAARVNLAVSDREAMTDEEVEHERRTNEDFEDFRQYTANFDRAEPEAPKPLQRGAGVPGEAGNQESPDSAQSALRGVQED
jgi:hypothetical protein